MEIKNIKKVMCCFENTLDGATIEAYVSRKYCKIQEKTDYITGLKTEILIIDEESFNKDYDFICGNIKNSYLKIIANEEYFSAIYVNRELYLKIED